MTWCVSTEVVCTIKKIVKINRDLIDCNRDLIDLKILYLLNLAVQFCNIIHFIFRDAGKLFGRGGGKIQNIATFVLLDKKIVIKVHSRSSRKTLGEGNTMFLNIYSPLAES